MSWKTHVVAVLAVGGLGVAPAAADRPSPAARPAATTATKPAKLAKPVAAKPVARPHGKPSAPVDLTATAQATAGGWQIVVTAAPTIAVDKLEIVVGRERWAYGKLAAGKVRTVTSAPIAVAPGAGDDVVVEVRTGGRSLATIVRVGAPAPAAAPKAIQVRTINGHAVSEVR